MRFRVEDYSLLEDMFHLSRRAPEQEIGVEHRDIAAALQKRTDDILMHLAYYLHQQTQVPNLCLAGGVALNCLSNEVIHTHGPFAHLSIQPAAHDAGTVLGAALTIWYKYRPDATRTTMTHVYYGPEYSDGQIEAALQEQSVSYQYSEHIEEEAAALLARGKIIGWFQGGLEFGPRALGNRSLLAHPGSEDMRTILNTMIKHRESFRPLAPSVLIETAQDWFVIPRPTPSSDFMLLAYPVKKEVAHKIPAVVHIDGTSRIQTVRQETNPRYHRLISAFSRITGIPILLNTSFNDNEPIVCTPQDAISTFLRTPQMDYIVLGNFWVERSAKGISPVLRKQP